AVVAAFEYLAVGIGCIKRAAARPRFDRDRAEKRALAIRQSAEQALPALSAVTAANDFAAGATTLVPVRGPAVAARQEDQIRIMRVDHHGVGILRTFHHRIYAPRPAPVVAGQHAHDGDGANDAIGAVIVEENAVDIPYDRDGV